jgi:hypothetical protein
VGAPEWSSSDWQEFGNSIAHSLGKCAVSTLRVHHFSSQPLPNLLSRQGAGAVSIP